MKTLHLMTQRGQPYGSSRKCCEMCGLMLVARPPEFWNEHGWTEEPAHYKRWPALNALDDNELITCLEKRRE